MTPSPDKHRTSLETTDLGAGHRTDQPPKPLAPPPGRLAYIDMLKGFAIFCVVMGHFLAWTFAPGTDRGQYPLFVKNILYSFHVFLFFFLSGFVVELRRKTWNLKTWGPFIGKRALALLLPGLTFMLFSYLRSGHWNFPWFLAALFEMLVLFSVPRLLLDRFDVHWMAEMAAHAVLWGGVASYVTLCEMGGWQQFISLKFMTISYPFFLFGYYACRWDLPRRVMEQKWLYTMALLAYAVLLYECLVIGRLPNSIMKYPMGLCAIVVLFRLAMEARAESGMGRMLEKLGKNSLCIYLLSSYFIPWFPWLGDLFIRSDAFEPFGLAGFHHVSSIFLQLTSGLLVSIYVCAACLLVKKVVSVSPFLDFLLFGTRKRP